MKIHRSNLWIGKDRERLHPDARALMPHYTTCCCVTTTLKRGEETAWFTRFMLKPPVAIAEPDQPWWLEEAVDQLFDAHGNRIEQSV